MLHVQAGMQGRHDMEALNAMLMEQLEAMKKQFIQDLLKKEEEIREEVALEMAEKLDEMEDTYRVCNASTEKKKAEDEKRQRKDG